MKTKTILFISLLLLLCSCDHPKERYNSKDNGSTKTYTIDSCEYIGVISLGTAGYLVHKGNCKFCIEREKQKNNK